MDPNQNGTAALVLALNGIKDAIFQNNRWRQNVNRRDDTTNSTPAVKTQIGTGRVVNSGIGTLSANITFPEAFDVIPVVVASCAGDGVSVNYGSGGLTLANGIVARINSVTTTGFNITLSKADGTNFTNNAAHFTLFSWIAMG